jgi:hypothetical protein
MSETELRHLMAAIDVPPTRADVQQAMVDGRRRSRNRAVVGAAVAVLVVAGGVVAVTQVNRPSSATPVPATPASKAAGCTVETYKVPEKWTAGTIDAIDDTGRYLVGTLSTGTVRTPVRWQHGVPAPLAGATGSAGPVNSSGVVAGADIDENDHLLGWVWKNGKMTRLAAPSGYLWTVPQGINARGDVVGFATSALYVSIPVLWPADHPGTVVKLQMPAGLGASHANFSRATGIDEHGTIVGVILGRPVRWSADGLATPLPLPGPAPTSGGGDAGTVGAIRGHFAFGTFYAKPAGSTLNDKSLVTAVRWDLRAGTVTSLAVGHFNGVSGAATGGAVTWNDDPNPSARITPDGRLIPLNQPSGGGALALEMSADGSTIIGQTRGDSSRPVVWHC